MMKTIIISMIRNGKNPQEIIMSLMEDSIKQGNPMMENLLTLAKDNRTEEIERIARNILNERGLDFDKEFNEFKHRLGF